MKYDPDLFSRSIYLTINTVGEFYNIPILASLDPPEFVSILLDAEAEKLSPISGYCLRRNLKYAFDKVPGLEKQQG